ncbi:hypothetical protein [Acanthamoeba polyphaga mimivirus]|uniref:Uncharacterized protein n=1 Tax=Acanthamoeba polyphaga mimivirus TaxID=212035 RepID=A0A2L2DIL0_MIMIV|nr:hypothetical protein [Acanthamoeba polyphaga mimivirus]AVG47082.1 hypothetical protein [Acanthamoeba polyphaga mimivirus]
MENIYETIALTNEIKNTPTKIAYSPVNIFSASVLSPGAIPNVETVNVVLYIASTLVILNKYR